MVTQTLRVLYAACKSESKQIHLRAMLIVGWTYTRGGGHTEELRGCHLGRAWTRSSVLLRGGMGRVGGGEGGGEGGGDERRSRTGCTAGIGGVGGGGGVGRLPWSLGASTWGWSKRERHS